MDISLNRATLFLFLIIAYGVPNIANADIRVWEQTPQEDDEDQNHRYLDITAFAQPGFIFRFADENAGITDSSPWLQRARLGINAQLMNWLRIRTEVEFAPVATLQDAYLDISPRQEFQIRAGQFQIPFLRAYQFNELNLGFIDRPLYTPLSPDRNVIRYLSPRDVGMMAFGVIGNTDASSHSPVLEYWAGAFIGSGPNVARNDDKAFLYAIRLQLNALGMPVGAQAESDIARNEHPRLGFAAAAYSNCDDRLNWNRGFVADTELRWQGLYASASFLYFKNGAATDHGFGEFIGNGSCTGGFTDSAGNTADFLSHGAHAQVQYVLPQMLFPVRNQAIELLARYDWVDPVSPTDSSRPFLGGDSNTPGYIAPSQLLDSDNAPTQWRMTFGINYFPTAKQSLRFSLNYQINREAEYIVTSEGTLVGVKNNRLWLQLTAGL